MKHISATTKGLITGIIMIIASIGIYVVKGGFDNSLQYVAYFVYVAGIVWALYDFHKSNAENKNFKAYFSTGFKCFVAVTFLMVLFTFVFNLVDPSLKEQMAANYRADLTKAGNYTPVEIDDKVKTAEDYFNIQITSRAIFGYLLIGTMVTVITSFLFSQQSKNQGPKAFT